MLKSLRISNIVLIENAEIPFAEGLNILTGETGSGKSAILGSLNLIAGARADTSMMRHGIDKGAIEAAFDIDSCREVQHLLTEAGISHESGEELIIKREMSRSGKSRVLINHQLAHVSLLRQIGQYLIEIVGQHANQRLMDLEQHREMLDLFGDHSPLLHTFRAHWKNECALKTTLAKLKNSEAERLRQVEICRMELEELEEAQIKEGEEEELFSEYTHLTHSEEIARHTDEIYQTLTSGNNPIVAQLNSLKHPFDQLLRHDPSLKDNAESFRSAIIEIEEVSHVIRNTHASIEYNPERIEEINDRLKIINQIKRKYGPEISDVTQYLESTYKKLQDLENADTQIEKIQEEIIKSEEQSEKLAKELSQKRQIAAKGLEKEMKKQLQALNMNKADFYVSLTKQPRSQTGDEFVEFLFTPNVGEKKLSIKECASGGELSRIMLALQTILAGKEKIPTIIFDEIDANIGGETAVVVGEKLKELGHGHQVLCVTHFPQVAKCAKHHLQISKQETEGRTYTEVSLLCEKGRKAELSRMEGKKSTKI